MLNVDVNFNGLGGLFAHICFVLFVVLCLAVHVGAHTQLVFSDCLFSHLVFCLLFVDVF